MITSPQNIAKTNNPFVANATSGANKKSPSNQLITPGTKSPQTLPNEEEVMFTIRMTREEYMKFLEAKSKKK